MADPREGGRDAPGTNIFLISYTFHTENLRAGARPSPLDDWRTLLWGILNTPLEGANPICPISMKLKQNFTARGGGAGGQGPPETETN